MISAKGTVRNINREQRSGTRIEKGGECGVGDEGEKRGRMRAHKERGGEKIREERNCESELGEVWSIRLQPPLPPLLIKSVNVTGRLM